MLDIPAGVRGYVNDLKIKDSTHLESILHIPSSASRDLTDAEIVTENGTEYLIMSTIGEKLIAEDAISSLPADLREVQLTSGAASWYNTDRRTVTLDIPEKAAVYVYDRHDHLTYSVYMKDSGKHYVKMLIPEGWSISITENRKQYGGSGHPFTFSILFTSPDRTATISYFSPRNYLDDRLHEYRDGQIDDYGNLMGPFETIDAYLAEWAGSD